MKKLFALLLLLSSCGSNEKQKFVGAWVQGKDYLVINAANGENVTVKYRTASEYNGRYYDKDAVGHYDDGCQCIKVAFGQNDREIVLTAKGVFMDRSGEFTKYVKP